jgi:hypothetical protein
MKHSIPIRAVAAWADFLPLTHFRSHTIIPRNPPEAIITSIIINMGGMKDSIKRFVLSVTVSVKYVPTVLNPCIHAPAFNGACGTELRKPPAIIAIPRLSKTCFVRKASKIAIIGGMILYHMAAEGLSSLRGEK